MQSVFSTSLNLAASPLGFDLQNGVWIICFNSPHEAILAYADVQGGSEDGDDFSGTAHGILLQRSRFHRLAGMAENGLVLWDMTDKMGKGLKSWKKGVCLGGTVRENQVDVRSGTCNATLYIDESQWRGLLHEAPEWKKYVQDAYNSLVGMDMHFLEELSRNLHEGFCGQQPRPLSRESSAALWEFTVEFVHRARSARLL